MPQDNRSLAVSVDAKALRWHAMTAADLDAVLSIESQSYSHPWTRGNFLDALRAGFHIQLLSLNGQLLGYSVAMMGYEEAHLLNITVHPQARSQGLAGLLLDALAFWAQRQAAQCIWLEVRLSHERTQKLYAYKGYEFVAIRKNYYPVDAHQREDAVVMKKTITPCTAETHSCAALQEDSQ